MKRCLRAFAGAAGLLGVWLIAETASAQKPGGVLQISHRDSPASMSTLENTRRAVVDDPDQQLYESYACESDRNFTGYCNRRLEDLFHRQSRETDPRRRRKLVWDIDWTLQEEGARPVIFHTRGATCWQAQVKGLTTMVNSMVNGWRMEDVWLDR
jgi:hypothetical protein